MEEDLKAGVLRRLPAMMRAYPQVDPWNVWDLPVNIWETLARNATTQQGGPGNVC